MYFCANKYHQLAIHQVVFFDWNYLALFLTICFHCPSFGCVHKIAKVTLSFILSLCPSVCPHWTSPFQPDRFSWYLIFDYFSKICRGNSSLIKIWQELPVLYMKTNIHFRLCLAQFFLKWEMFWTKVVEKAKTHISCSVTFFPKIVQFMRQSGKIL